MRKHWYIHDGATGLFLGRVKCARHANVHAVLRQGLVALTLRQHMIAKFRWMEARG